MVWLLNLLLKLVVVAGDSPANVKDKKLMTNHRRNLLANRRDAVSHVIVSCYLESERLDRIGMGEEAEKVRISADRWHGLWKKLSNMLVD